MLHAARRLSSWLIYDVRRYRSYEAHHIAGDFSVEEQSGCRQVWRDSVR
jgi:hypothetical protein